MKEKPKDGLEERSAPLPTQEDCERLSKGDDGSQVATPSQPAVSCNPRSQDQCNSSKRVQTPKAIGGRGQAAEPDSKRIMTAS